VARARIQVEGAVQGVGFRPFIFRLARELSLEGSVLNDTRGVVIEVQGDRSRLETFLRRLEREKPAPASIDEIRPSWLKPRAITGFRIERSAGEGAPKVQIPPDIATCSECLGEVFDPGNRRNGYPFTNCTNCGPRFTVIRSLPYDRPRTTMAGFPMCKACRQEYEDPMNRRFHAQPNACPECGPRLALWRPDGTPIAMEVEALERAVAALRAGQIVAVKGLGGFHLVVDAGHGQALARLREKKPRRSKPFAVMARDLTQARRLCEVDTAAATVLVSPEAPIVLLRRRPGDHVHEEVAPGNPYLGLMLPANPLHHLLMRRLGRPVVATSGNLSDEPICTDEMDAIRRLGHVADLFLVHDRPIARHMDDSIVWVNTGAPRILRRARGHAPRPVRLAAPVPCLLAVGGHLKNTVALSVDRQVFLSQHIGDMETPEALTAFTRVIDDFLRLYDATPAALVHDAHPDYVTTRLAQERAAGSGLPLIAVQHHHAHMAACLAENHLHGRALGVTWDGTGFGTDGTVWGGEFLQGDAGEFQRAAHLRPFRLPGADAAVRQARRSALALLWELEGGAALGREDLRAIRSFTPAERRLLAGMLDKGIQSPTTTSAGRLFDGIAALLDLCQHSEFEGQAAMALEFASDPDVSDSYSMPVTEEPGGLVLDWGPLVEAALEESRRGVAPGAIAARFHNTLAEAIVNVARLLGEGVVALSGGCFQNRLLTGRTAGLLREAGFTVLLHREVPPNDGGISLGQIAVAAARWRRSGDDPGQPSGEPGPRGG
jgi:hydrogenase maturation protein HypF